MRGRVAGLAFGVLATALVGGAADAQSSGGTYRITREVIAAGGVRASGGSYDAITTSGQAASGVQSGGAYVLRGGFHVPAATALGGGRIFADGFGP